MKNKVLLSLLTLFIVSCGPSKVVYFGPENNQISSEEFKALDEHKVYKVKTKKDTAIVERAFFVNKTGQEQELAILLASIIGPEFDRRENTVIHLYSENNSAIEKASHRERYWSWINDNSADFQAFLIGTKNSGIKANKKLHIYLDKNNLLKNTFFKNSNFTINHLYLKPSGEYFIYNGGKDILRILDNSVGR